jgi:hypothetical protein
LLTAPVHEGKKNQIFTLEERFHTLLPQQSIIFHSGILTFRRADVETEVLIGCCAAALLLSSVSLRKSRA